MFEELPRQGPGSDESTAHAFSFIRTGQKKRKILDIGCGSGMQTLALARICPDCLITAIDRHQPFLDDLTLRAKNAGLDGRIVTQRVSMDNLPFDTFSFDIIWAEGSLFIIGLGPALRYWKKFLKPDGYLVFSDLTWFTDLPSEECREFLDELCPDLPSQSKAEEIIRSEGYSIVNSFQLPVKDWWNNFYDPLTIRIEMLKEKYANNHDALLTIQGLEREREIFRKHSDEYGYVFFILNAPVKDSSSNSATSQY